MGSTSEPPAYAELAVTTNFSFLHGASHPGEMVGQAAELGLHAIGIADRNTLAGVVRGHAEAKRRAAAGEPGIRFLPGVRLVTEEGFEAVAYPMDRAAYGRLCRLLTLGNRRSEKGRCRFGFDEFLAASAGQMLIAIPPEELAGEDFAGRDLVGRDLAGMHPFLSRLAALVAQAPGRVTLAGSHRRRGDERRRLGRLAAWGERLGAPLVAVSDALYHHPDRRPLQDIVACIREGCTLAAAGYRLEANAERHLRPAAEMARLFADHPEALARTIEIAETCSFSLDELTYEYPDEPVPPGFTAQAYLTDQVLKRARWRYPDGIPEQIVNTIQEELRLIEKMDYARYFLTLFDIVEFARKRGILCQGRGSAANSVVCYCLGITAVDPTEIRLLFARFISENRAEPPDIDVDFEHERREEVIQYLYDRYGRDRAAICATVIHYRPRSAIREVGKVLGLPPDITGVMADTVWGSWGKDLPDAHIRQAGLDPDNPAIRQALELAHALIGFPRHLSQHVGGFVLTRGRLDETVPVGNAAMADRTFIEWDKDDIDVLGLMKVDVLALGMLSCLRRGVDFLRQRLRARLSDARRPAARGRGHLRDAGQGRFRRRVPGREPGADVDAAAPEAAGVLRPRGAGGDRPARADPGRHGPPLPAPPPGAGARRATPPPIPITGRRTSSRACSGGPTACPCSRSTRCRSPSPPPGSSRTRPTACAGPWRPSGTTARS